MLSSSSWAPNWHSSCVSLCKAGGRSGNAHHSCLSAAVTCTSTGPIAVIAFLNQLLCQNTFCQEGIVSRRRFM